MIYKILSIDGGGIRGVYPAQILHNITSKLEINLFDSFDMITGTSTGAIIAAAVALNKEPEKIVDLYNRACSTIFKPKCSIFPRSIRSVFHSVYKTDSLESLLKAEFGGVKLGEIKKPLILPATDISNGVVHVFKSGYSEMFVRDKDVLLCDAILASCSAPTYFDPKKLENYLLADGGLWANNPSMVALTEARKIFGVQMEDMRVLSIGTGSKTSTFGTNIKKSWGLMFGWKNKELVNFFMSINTQSVNNYLELILTKKSNLRINFNTDLPLPLDDCKSIEELKSRADKDFSHRVHDVKEFFEK